MAIEKVKRKRSATENNDDRSEKKKTTVSSSSKEGAGEQLRFFVDQFQEANHCQLSSIELESFKDTSILELSHSQDTDTDNDVKMLGDDIKAAFGKSWKEVLCEGDLLQGKIPAGSPSVVILSSSALRSIHLLKGFRSFTKQCSAVKLFSKHIKLQEQVNIYSPQLHFINSS